MLKFVSDVMESASPELRLFRDVICPGLLYPIDLRGDSILGRVSYHARGSQTGREAEPPLLACSAKLHKEIWEGFISCPIEFKSPRSPGLQGLQGFLTGSRGSRSSGSSGNHGEPW